jgi:spermidine/putrescine transport system substrate-binding protein
MASERRRRGLFGPPGRSVDRQGTKAPAAGLSRRRVLGYALAAPAVLRASDALSSSGRLNIFAWGDYFDKNSLLARFEAETGIKVSLSTYGANEELENKLRSAGGAGFDLIFPSVDTGPQYYRDGLLTEIDERRFDALTVLPTIWRRSISLGATYRGRRYLIPFVWGTEALTYDIHRWPATSGQLSWSLLWEDGLERRVALRQKSVLTSIALHLQFTGRIAQEGVMDMYRDEAAARRVFDACLAFAIAHKRNFGAFWNNANEATAAFTDAGCLIGQTWDTTGLLLNRKVDPRWRYGMPREGGLAWTDTVGIPVGSVNVEQAYAFLGFLFRPLNGAEFSNTTGYNTCSQGASAFLSEEARAAYEMSYPPGTVEALWWWPIQTPVFSRLRGEFVEKLTNA